MGHILIEELTDGAVTVALAPLAKREGPRAVCEAPDRSEKRASSAGATGPAATCDHPLDAVVFVLNQCLENVIVS